jgi:TPR repeat protein
MRHHTIRNTLLISTLTMALGGSANAATALADYCSSTSPADYGLNSNFIKGNRYANGYGVPQDYTEAAKFFRLAANEGYTPAQFSLGYLYERGNGVAKDYAEAAKLYLLAAKQEEPRAEFRLGLMLEKGIGVEQDRDAAIRLYKMAAAQGNLNAENKLGVKRDTRICALEFTPPLENR